MDQVQEIKNKLNIVEVVREYIPQLKQAGSNWKGLCPFHNEKTPSFMVSEEKQFWHCFGCGEGGDVFEFVKKIENVEFTESLRILAQKAGVVLKKQDPKLLDLRARLIDIHQAAAKFFMAHLWQTKTGNEALNYLRQRGLQDETIQEWKLGWAPDTFDKLKNHLQERGFSENEIKKSGLVFIKEHGSFYDRFHNRIMFPLFDVHGQIIAFTGRLIKETPNQGKYVNSPETILYSKSQVLYGLYQGKEDIKSSSRVILVEGQMDVITCHQAGFFNVVASSGTALTTEQLSLLKRYAAEIVFAFDADNAGAKAILRSTELALRAGWRIHVLILPAGEDPDSFVKKNPKQWPQLIASAPEFMEYFFDYYKNTNDITTLTGKKQIIKDLLSLIVKLPDPIEKDFYLQKLSNLVNISESALRESMPKINQVSTDKENENIWQEISHQQKMSQRYLAWLLVKADWWSIGLEQILPEMLSGADEQELYSQLIIYYTNNVSQWSQELLQTANLEKILNLTPTQEKVFNILYLLVEDLKTITNTADALRDWDQLLKNIQKNFYREQLNLLKNQTIEAEKNQDEEALEKISIAMNQVLSRLAKLK